MALSVARAKPVSDLVHTYRGRLTRYQALASDSGVIFASNMANAVFGFAFWTIAAHAYSSHAVGLGSAMVSACALLGNVALLGLNTALVREIGGKSSRARQAALSFVGLAIVGGVGLVLGLVFAGQSIVATDVTAEIRAHALGLAGFGLACAAGALWLLIDPLLIIINRRRFVFYENIAYSLAKLVAVLLMLPVVGERWGILASVGLGSAAGVLVALRALFRQLERRRWRSLVAGFGLFRPSLIRYALGNHVSALVAGLPTWILPLVVTEHIGASANAHFYTAWMIATLLNMAPAALGTAVFANNARQGGSSKISPRLLVMATGLMVPVVACVTLGSGIILSIFGRGYAANGAELLRYLVLASIPLMVVHIGFAELRIRGRFTRLGFAATCQSAIAIAGSYLTLPVWGLNGVGISWLVASTVTALLCVAFTRSTRGDLVPA